LETQALSFSTQNLVFFDFSQISSQALLWEGLYLCFKNLIYRVCSIIINKTYE
jgi:hypothetical protein